MRHKGKHITCAETVYRAAYQSWRVLEQTEGLPVSHALAQATFDIWWEGFPQIAANAVISHTVKTQPDRWAAKREQIGLELRIHAVWRGYVTQKH